MVFIGFYNGENEYGILGEFKIIFNKCVNKKKIYL